MVREARSADCTTVRDWNRDAWRSARVRHSVGPGPHSLRCRYRRVWTLCVEGARNVEAQNRCAGSPNTALPDAKISARNECGFQRLPRSVAGFRESLAGKLFLGLSTDNSTLEGYRKKLQSDCQGKAAPHCETPGANARSADPQVVPKLITTINRGGRR